MDLRCGSIGVRANQKEAVDLAHRHGFESVEPSARELERLTDTELKAFLADLKAKGLSLSSAGLPVNFRGAEDRFRGSLEGLPNFSRAIQRAGVTRVNTWIGPAHSTLTYLENFKLHVKRLREIAKVLGEHELRLGLEYVGPFTSWSRERHPFIHTMAETRELIAEIGAGNVGFVLDSWHWYHAEENAADVRSLKNEDIVAVDLNDAPTGIPRKQQADNRRELPAATGAIDLASFLNSLNELGYDGPVRAEPFNARLNKLGNEEAVAETAKAMQKAFALIR